MWLLLFIILLPPSMQVFIVSFVCTYKHRPISPGVVNLTLQCLLHYLFVGFVFHYSIANLPFCETLVFAFSFELVQILSTCEFFNYVQLDYACDWQLRRRASYARTRFSFFAIIFYVIICYTYLSSSTRAPSSCSSSISSS